MSHNMNCSNTEPGTTCTLKLDVGNNLPSLSGLTQTSSSVPSLPLNSLSMHKPNQPQEGVPSSKFGTNSNATSAAVSPTRSGGGSHCPAPHPQRSMSERGQQGQVPTPLRNSGTRAAVATQPIPEASTGAESQVRCDAFDEVLCEALSFTVTRNDARASNQSGSSSEGQERAQAGNLPLPKALLSVSDEQLAANARLGMDPITPSHGKNPLFLTGRRMLPADPTPSLPPVPQVDPLVEALKALEERISSRPPIVKNKRNLLSRDILEFMPFAFQPFERAELGELENVWFTNNPSLNALLNVIPQKPFYDHSVDMDPSGDPEFTGSFTENNGYDNKEGCYRFTLGEHIEYRYEILSFLGKGSFGQVVKCFDHKRDCIVALKMARNKRRLQQQATSEITMLEKLMQLPLNLNPATIEDDHRKHLVPHAVSPHCGENTDGDAYGEWTGRYRPLTYEPSPHYDTLTKGHHHIVRVQGYFTFRSHVCVTFEPLSVNLYEFLRMNNHFGLSTVFTRRIASQILLTLCFLYSHNVIHCDLKPENILFVPYNLNEGNRAIRIKSIDNNGPLPHISTSVRVIDFGSSSFTNENLFTYVQSRFYRAPEIILGLNYSTAVDMWSMGCILAELWLGYPLFPGETEEEQMILIVNMLGLPPPYVLRDATRAHHYFAPDGRPHSNLAAQIEYLAGAGVQAYYESNKGLARVNSIMRKALVRYGYVASSETRGRSSDIVKAQEIASFYQQRRAQLGINPRDLPATPLDIIGQNEPMLHNLILACLQWDANMRITPKQALQHFFFGCVDQNSTACMTALQQDVVEYVLAANMVAQK